MADENTNGPPQPIVPAQPEWLTAAEVAELIGASVQTVYELASTNKIPGARKFGRTWRVKRAEFLASNTAFKEVT